jgi:septum formation protein
MTSLTPSPQRPASSLILASASPRRQQLLSEAGYTFSLHPANVDEESYPSTLLPIDLARTLAIAKARAIAPQFPQDLVLGADTVVAFGDRSLGKPEDAEDARQMLWLLSGTTHIVITGVALVRFEPPLDIAKVAMSAVRMRALSKREIDAYVASGDWQGKAGGYGIQDPDPFVTKVSGSWSNIVGLPMELVSEMLADAGLFPAA